MNRIEIKDLDVLNVHPILQPIVTEAMARYELSIITSAYRPGDEGVHGQMPVRGIDLRCWDREYGVRIETEVNARWVYDPDRPAMKVCTAHDTGSGYHLHFQCHRNTVRKN
jgi:hypothetical protein